MRTSLYKDIIRQKKGTTGGVEVVPRIWRNVKKQSTERQALESGVNQGGIDDLEGCVDHDCLYDVGS